MTFKFVRDFKAPLSFGGVTCTGNTGPSKTVLVCSKIQNLSAALELLTSISHSSKFPQSLEPFNKYLMLRAREYIIVSEGFEFPLRVFGLEVCF